MASTSSDAPSTHESYLHPPELRLEDLLNLENVLLGNILYTHATQLSEFVPYTQGVTVDPQPSVDLHQSSETYPNPVEASQPPPLTQVPGDAATAAPVTLNPVGSQNQTRHLCPWAGCGRDYKERKGLNRHMKCEHKPPIHCFDPSCDFEWPEGRRYMYVDHLKEVHGLNPAASGT